MKPYAVADGGAGLAVRLTPRASRNGVDGIALDAEGRPHPEAGGWWRHPLKVPRTKR